MPEVLDKRIFTTLFTAVFAMTMGVGLVIPLLPIYAHEKGAGGFYIGMIFGAFSLSRSLFLPMFGKWSDRKGRKIFLCIGLFGYCLVSLGLIYWDSISGLITIRFAQGIASAMILPVAQAYVGDIGPPHKEGRIMGLFQLSLLGGLSAGPLLGGVVNDILDMHSAFLSMGIVCFIAFCLCFIFLPNEAKQAGVKKRGMGLSMWSLLKNRSMISLFVHRVCLASSIGVIWSFLPLHANTHAGMSSSSVGILLTLNVALSALVMYPMGMAADRIDKRIPVALGGFVAAGAVFALIYAKDYHSMMIASGLHGLAGGIVTPSVMAMATISGRDNKAMGSTMGLIAMAHSLGMLIGPVFGGLIVDAISFESIFFFGGTVLVLGTAFILLMISSKLARPYSSPR